MPVYLAYVLDELLLLARIVSGLHAKTHVIVTWKIQIGIEKRAPSYAGGFVLQSNMKPP
jgi:hypothetical protein